MTEQKHRLKNVLEETKRKWGEKAKHEMRKKF